MVTIPTIMSTTHHQVAGKCNSSGTRARVKWLLRSPKYRLSVSTVSGAFRGSIWESRRQKVHRTAARARFALQNRKLPGTGHFLKRRSA